MKVLVLLRHRMLCIKEKNIERVMKTIDYKKENNVCTKKNIRKIEKKILQIDSRILCLFILCIFFLTL